MLVLRTTDNIYFLFSISKIINQKINLDSGKFNTLDHDDIACGFDVGTVLPF